MTVASPNRADPCTPKKRRARFKHYDTAGYRRPIDQMFRFPGGRRFAPDSGDVNTWASVFTSPLSGFY